MDESRAAQGTTQRVSVDSVGIEGNGASETPAISADGRYVAFTSFASNLVSGDTNGTYDVFLYDRETAQTSRVSVATDGSEANGSSRTQAPIQVAMSDDSRFVAFNSLAENLGADPEIGAVFVHDRQDASTTMVSFNPAGQPISGRADLCDISGDGQLVAFHAGNRLFLGNIVGQSTELLSADADCGALSGDGRFIAYLGVGSQVVVLDRETGIQESVSVTDSGELAGEASTWPSISSDGRFVAFETRASNLDPADDNGVPDIFLRDRATRTTTLVSRGDDGSPVGGSLPRISGGGRHVVFKAWTGRDRLLIYDSETGSTETVSVNSTGEDAEGAVPAVVQAPQDISGDGGVVAFDSDASNLVEEDTNRESDVFVRDREASASTKASPTSASGNQEQTGNENSTLIIPGVVLGVAAFACVVAVLVLRKRRRAQ